MRFYSLLLWAYRCISYKRYFDIFHFILKSIQMSIAILLDNNRIIKL